MVRRLLVLGAGAAGTMAANKLRRKLDEDWIVTVVDADDEHHYQPGYLLLPFGEYEPADLVKSRRSLLDPAVDLVYGEIDLVEPDKSSVKLTDGRSLDYDQLIIATGTHPRPEETPGLDSDEAGVSIHSFYTLEGSVALRDALADWEGGRLVINIVDMPIKCPVAPLEFTFLSHAFFEDRGLADKVDITYVTPLPGAFTKPVASKFLGDMLDVRGISVESDFYIEEVDSEGHRLVSYDEREVPYDLLVTIPLNMGAAYIGRSGLGDELDHVPVDKHTFLSRDHDNIFAIGDAANLPTSKAGSVAHFSVDVLTENFVDHINGRPMRHHFDGHSNCFIESGHGKASLIDFNYDTEPLPGKYPLPGVGPLTLLGETEMNHWGKLLFRSIYWNVLMPGRPLFVPADMSMLGKIPQEA